MIKSSLHNSYEREYIKSDSLIFRKFSYTSMRQVFPYSLDMMGIKLRNVNPTTINQTAHRLHGKSHHSIKRLLTVTA